MKKYISFSFLSLFFVIIILGVLRPYCLAYYHYYQSSQILYKKILTSENDYYSFPFCDSYVNLSHETRVLLKSARGHLFRALEYKQSLSEVYLLLGQVNCLLRKNEQAVQNFKNFLELRPEHPLARIELAINLEIICVSKFGSSDLFTISSPEKYLCSNTRLISNASDEWKEAKVSAQDFYTAGEENRKQGHLVNAQRWYARGIITYPENGYPWLGLGNMLLDIGESDYAIQAYEIGWGFSPGLITKPLAEMYNRYQNYIMMEKMLRQVLFSDQDSEERIYWWRLLGDNLQSQAKWQDSIGTYNNALIEFPSDLYLLIGLGWSHYYNGDNQHAMDIFIRAINQNQTLGNGYIAIGELLSKEMKYLEADVWYQRGIERNKNVRWWHVLRGNSARAGEEYELAIKVFQEAIQFFQNYSLLYYELSWAYHLNQQNFEAVQTIEYTLNLEEAPNKNYYNRAGLIYAESGDVNNALLAYTHSLELDPTNKTALEGIQSLESR